MIPDNNPDSTLHTRHALTLPSGTDVAADLLYDPGLSVVVLPAEIEQEIGDLVGVVQFPIIFAGQYASSPLTDALGVITQQAQCALQRFAASDWERYKTAEHLVALKRISRLLIQEYGSAIQTVTCWSLQRVLSEHDFLEMVAADYATGKQHVNKTAVISIFD